MNLPLISPRASLWIVGSGTAALAATALASIFLFGSDVPCWDDWEMVPFYAGAEPVTASWLWSLHNEHRLVLPRIVYVAAARASHGRLTVLMFASAALYLLLTLASLAAVRRRRGRLVAADLLFPLVLLNPGNVDNLTSAFQIGIALPVALFGFAVLLIPSAAQGHGAARPALGALALLLSLCGGGGLALAFPLAVWLASAAGPTAVGGGDGRGPAAVALALALGTLLVSAAYFVGFHPPLHHPPPPGLFPVIRTAKEFLAQSAGPQPLCPGWIVAVLAAAVWCGTFGALLRALPGALGDGRGPLGFLAALAGVAALAGAVGVGRAGLGEDSGAAARYAIFAGLGIFTARWAWLHLPARAWFHAATLAFTALLLASLPGGVGFALRSGGWQRAKLRAVENDVLSGMPSGEIAITHGNRLNYRHPRVTEARLEMLRAAGLAPFRKKGGDAD